MRVFIDSLIQRYVLLSARAPIVLACVFAVVAACAVIPISHLRLRTDLAALLPDQHPAVLALRRIEGRTRSSQFMFVSLRGPQKDADHACLDSLHAPLSKLVPEHFSEIQWQRTRELPDFIWRNRWLYASLADLNRVDELSERLVARKTSPLLVDLDDEDPEVALRALRSDLEKRLPEHASEGSAKAEYFESTVDGVHYLTILLWRRLDGIGSKSDRDAVGAVKDALQAAHGHGCAPDIRLDVGGQLVVGLEEQDAIRDDLSLATALCTLLVLLAIYLHFRRVLLVALVGAPAIFAVLLSLALASLTIGELNANSAFLISIILGNGINPAIIVLASYSEERLAGADGLLALRRALAATLRGTGTAMTAASICYGCLALTSFRGFSQFGFIGGVGMILSWLSTLFLIPPLIILCERLAKALRKEQPKMMEPRPSFYRRPMAAFAKLASQKPLVLLLLAVSATVLSGLALWRYAEDPLEWNFSKLRAKETPAQVLGLRLAQVGLGDIAMGYVGTYGVLRVDQESESEPVAEVLRKRNEALGDQKLIAIVRTLPSLLPDHQDEKLVILRRLRTRLNRHRDILDDDVRLDLDRMTPPADLHALAIGDLPAPVRLAFTEIDGQRGRLIGIDQAPSYSDWDGKKMLRMAKLLSFDAVGKHWVVACSSTIFGGMLESMLRDGPRVTAAALVGVLLLILLVFGLRDGGPVILALAIGVMWMGGLAQLLHIKLNYINFVTLPITLGIGTDYAANIWARYRQARQSADGSAPREQMAAVLIDTGTAVALCSLTTIIGYSSLLLAGNRALRSFGLLADVGEVSCLWAALMALPLLVYFARRRHAKLPTP